jgi:hypothetical protein
MKQYIKVYVNILTEVIEHIHTSDIPIIQENILDNTNNFEIYNLEMVSSDSKFIRAKELIKDLEKKPDKTINYRKLQNKIILIQK